MPNFNRIRLAVGITAAGDTVLACDGVYTADVDITKRLTLVGSGNSMIQAPASNPAGGDLVTVQNGAVGTMSGFIVTGPERWCEPPLLLGAKRPHLAATGRGAPYPM
jgi:hypothetical protein